MDSATLSSGLVGKCPRYLEGNILLQRQKLWDYIKGFQWSMKWVRGMWMIPTSKKLSWWMLWTISFLSLFLRTRINLKLQFALRLAHFERIQEIIEILGHKWTSPLNLFPYANSLNKRKSLWRQTNSTWMQNKRTAAVRNQLSAVRQRRW